MTPWTPLTPRLFAWQAPHFNSLQGCLMPLTPLTPRLSRMAGAALGDSREGCLTRSPRLSHAAGAALGDSLEGWLTPLTPRLFLVAGLALGGSLGGLLDAVALGDFVESCFTPSAPI